MTQVAPAFALVLQRHRSELNARFQAARHSAPALDGEDFLQCLRVFVSPLVEHCDTVSEERTDEVGVVLYDVALQLWSRGMLGPESRCAPLNRAWNGLLPLLPALIVQSPKRVVGSMSNAVVQLAQTRGARVDEWITLMGEIAPQCRDVEQLLNVGHVVAWRCGLAHGRTKALAACWALPRELTCTALGVPGKEDCENTILHLERDLWFKPGDASTQDAHVPGVTAPLRLVAQVGGFHGFGGEFFAPPYVVLWNGSLHVINGENAWRIFADSFGTTLARAAVPVQQPKTTLDVSTHGQVLAALPEARLLQSWASDGRTLAVTVATSHHVFLFA